MKNFEKFKTVDDRANGYEDFCSNHECEYCPLNNTKPDCGQSRGQFAWLDLEADQEQPLPCPCCGNIKMEKNGYISPDQRFDISCPSCGYRSPWEMNLDAAIARHNKLCRQWGTSKPIEDLV